MPTELWGGNGGIRFDDGYNAVGIRKIIISSGDVVDNLTIEYVHSNGSTETKSHGGGGGTSHEIVLAYPTEVVTLIEGTWGQYCGMNIILSLEITTSTGRKYGPYGRPGTGTHFSEKRQRIVGFFGRAGKFLDAVGVYGIEPTIPCAKEGGKEFDKVVIPSLGFTPSPGNKSEPAGGGSVGKQRCQAWLKMLCCGAGAGNRLDEVNEQSDYGIKPSTLWGGPGGNAFDDGKEASGISKMVVAAGDVVDNLTIAYVNSDGKTVTKSHGGNGGISHEIVLDYPNEVLTLIEGTWGFCSRVANDVIFSLEITTSTGRKYGPYGSSNKGTRFSTNNAGQKIVGFFGRAGIFLDALGVYVIN